MVLAAVFPFFFFFLNFFESYFKSILNQENSETGFRNAGFISPLLLIYKKIGHQDVWGLVVGVLLPRSVILGMFPCFSRAMSSSIRWLDRMLSHI